jgi:hypothetical protein
MTEAGTSGESIPGTNVTGIALLRLPSVVWTRRSPVPPGIPEMADQPDVEIAIRSAFHEEAATSATDPPTVNRTFPLTFPNPLPISVRPYMPNSWGRVADGRGISRLTIRG